MLTTLFQSFGCGIAFAFGAFVGITAITTIKDKGFSKEVRDHYKRVEERLGHQAESVARIAEALERKAK
jgi:hypothetical protein